MNSITWRDYSASEWTPLVFLAAIKLLIPFITSGDFGFHRDEFLYMAMGDHLAWGYLEVPPAIAVLGKLSRFLFGDTLEGVRFLPALFGALTLILTGRLAKELGGGRFAQILAAIAYLFSLVYLRVNMLFQPVTFDLFWFVLGVYLFVRVLKTEDRRLWLAFGVVVGIGLMTKYTMLLLVFGVAVSLLLTPHRKMLSKKWPWLGAIVALAIWLPNLVWQHRHGWPFFEHIRVLSESQLANVEPATFLLVQVLMNLYATPVWLLGLYWCFFSKEGRAYRALGWLYLSMLVVLLFVSGKVYYLAPAYPMLFAAGSVLIERFARRKQHAWPKFVSVSVIVIGSSTLIPVGVPIFSVDGMIRYFEFGSKYLGLREALRWETGKFHELPQDYADMLGWQEQVATVAQVYHELPPAQKARSAVFASNYGEAGAIDHYGERYDLPKAICHNGSYWLWGYRDYSGEMTVSIGFDREDLALAYDDIELGAIFRYPHARESGTPVHVARQPKISMAELWAFLESHRF